MPERDEQPEVQPEQGTRRVISVLIADDHALLSESLRTVLDNEPGIRVVGVAGTLRETQELLDRTSPDVLLLDHHMPDGEGVPAVATFKRRHPRTAIVVVTASTSDRILLSAIEAGAAGFVSKAHGLSQLTSSVRSAGQGEPVISEAVLARLLRGLRHREAPAPPNLTPRETEVLQLVGRGLTNAQIARELVVSINTVRNHVASIGSKLGAHSKLETMVVATRLGLLPADRA